MRGGMASQGFMATYADGTQYQFQLNDRGEAHITACSTQQKTLRIPFALDGHPVTELGEGSFARLGKTERVTCPSSLRRIRRHAFRDCNRLRSVTLNEGLRTLESEAFLFCFLLKDVRVPATLNSIGENLTGVSRSAFFESELTLAIDERNPHLFFDENQVLYQRNGETLSLVDGSRFTGALLRVAPRTTRVGRGALAQCDALEHVVLPAGVVSIGENAFRGCRKLKRIDVPESLEEIGSGAFSCTALESLYLPAGCVRLRPQSLHLGPVLEKGVCGSYQSSLGEISVHPENPCFFLYGGVLCRRLDAAGADGQRFEALLCPSRCPSVHLDRSVTRVLQTAFAGTVSIGELRLHEGLVCEGAEGILLRGGCDRLTIDLAEPVAGRAFVSVEVPSGAAGRSFLKHALGPGVVSAARVLTCYDETVAGLTDPLERARCMVARLADPVHLTAQSRAAFADTVAAALESICVHFGLRGYTEGFDHLRSAGMLDAGNISDIIATLSRAGDVPSVGYLLNMKRTFFGKAAWDYAL